MTAVAGHRFSAMARLQRAQEVRLARVAILGRLSPKTLTRERAADLIERPPDELLSATLGHVLRHINRWGPDRIRVFVGDLSLREAKTIGSMTERQRKAVAGALRGRS